MSRRDALKTGAIVAGTAVWVTPVIEALTVSRASAAQPSGREDDQGQNNNNQG